MRIGRHLEVGFQVDGGVDGGLLHQIVDVEVVVPEIKHNFKFFCSTDQFIYIVKLVKVN